MKCENRKKIQRKKTPTTTLHTSTDLNLHTCLDKLTATIWRFCRAHLLLSHPWTEFFHFTTSCCCFALPVWYHSLFTCSKSNYHAVFSWCAHIDKMGARLVGFPSCWISFSEREHQHDEAACTDTKSDRVVSQSCKISIFWIFKMKIFKFFNDNKSNKGFPLDLSFCWRTFLD